MFGPCVVPMCSEMVSKFCGCHGNADAVLINAHLLIFLVFAEYACSFVL